MRIQSRFFSLDFFVIMIACFLSCLLWTYTVSAMMGDREITDIAVKHAVNHELLVDPVAVFDGVDVEVTDGIVELSGTVDNILSKDRARRIAEAVKGVRSVVNLVSVVPSVSRSDSVIQEEVKDALRDDPATDSFEIIVMVDHNEVTLLGDVDSWQERLLAKRTAKRVKGVKKVDNQIKVTYGEERDDGEIKTEIEQALRWHVLVDDALIDVNVEKGDVRLSGVVGSAAEKRIATAHSWVAGVKSVNNDDLRVERWARDEDLRKNKFVLKTDQQIAQAVEDAFLYDPRVYSFDVGVSVSNGVVTLTGVVDNLKAKRAAARDARNTVGVFRVRNQMKVRPETAISDRKLARKVRTALLRNPFTESYEIRRVVVRNGVVDLYGSVDTSFEKAEAEDVAARVNGVVRVDNNLVSAEYAAPLLYDPYVDDFYPYDYRWSGPTPAYPLENDREIKADIEDELWWSPFVDSDDVKVSVDEGRAILTGAVDSWSEYHAASENALEGGAVWVTNNLVVKSNPG